MCIRDRWYDWLRMRSMTSEALYIAAFAPGAHGEAGNLSRISIRTPFVLFTIFWFNGLPRRACRAASAAPYPKNAARAQACF
eukprot:802226-Pyramimonas_sp.AAC.1